jgi:opacity protein-like surface antigen
MIARSISTLAVASLLALPAFAGGTAPQTGLTPVVAPAPAAGTDWTGAYAGLQAENGNATILGGPPDPEFDGTFLGVFGGYRYDFGTWVLGGEIDYVTGELTSAIPAGSVDDLLRAGVELGFDAGQALFYGTAGWARVGLTDPVGATDNDGYFYGVGMDYLVTDRITVGFELLWHDFDEVGNPPPATMDMTTIGINAGIRF